ncbi:MAG: M20/M25/M40 family metallo-hydrolase [Proteobacteria bacterium]|nr:M20/M25/M40 family metallo-hydrolase [Pseudomonadota bacterium]
MSRLHRGAGAALAVAVGFAAAAASAAALEVTPELAATSRALAGGIVVGGASFETLGELADGIGPRLSGSEGYERAVQWAIERFRRAGVDDVHVEPVTLAHGWQRGSAAATLVAPQRRALHVTAFGWSPPTPAGGLRAPVVALRDITDAAIAEAGVRGAIVLLDRAALTGPTPFQRNGPDDYARQARYERLDRILADAGARAVLVFAKTPNQVLRTSDPESGGAALALPMGSVGHEDGLWLRRLLANGPATLDLHFDTALSGPVTISNVIAQIRGRELPDEVVMLGAHLDSWDLGTGAQDNGSGCAEVLEVARAVAALPRHPRRTLRFALWASEEQGLNGSVAYARGHAGEMKHVVAYLNSDTGAGRPTGWSVNGRQDVADAIAPLAPLLQSLSGMVITQELSFDTDTGPFLIAGVPVLELGVVDDEYDSLVHHKPADTLDKVDPRDLAAGAAVLAITAHALAEAPHRPVARLGRDGVEAILRRAGALEYVRDSNLNDLWRD